MDFTLLNAIGWFGSIMFAICGIPLAYQCYKDGHSKGLSNAFLTMWFLGEVATIIYVIPKKDVPLLFNYSINLTCLLVVIYYKFFERKPKE